MDNEAFTNISKEGWLILLAMIILALLIFKYPGTTINRNNNQRTEQCNKLGYVYYENFLCVGERTLDGTIDISKGIQYPKGE